MWNPSKFVQFHMHWQKQIPVHRPTLLCWFFFVHMYLVSTLTQWRHTKCFYVMLCYVIFSDTQMSCLWGSATCCCAPVLTVRPSVCSVLLQYCESVLCVVVCSFRIPVCLISVVLLPVCSCLFFVYSVFCLSFAVTWWRMNIYNNYSMCSFCFLSFLLIYINLYDHKQTRNACEIELKARWDRDGHPKAKCFLRFHADYFLPFPQIKMPRVTKPLCLSDYFAV